MNGKQLAVLITLIAAASLLLSQHQGSRVSEFEAWKTQHGISFASEIENVYRERVFLKNLAEIKAHNSDELRTYNMGLNQFSAMTQEEFASTYLTLQIPQGENRYVDTEDKYLGDIDWTTKGAVTGVKNQGSCGSCWAFSTTGALEALSKSKGSLQSFSEQQLVDCSGSYGNKGCSGGLMNSAFNYVKDKGITTESSYPYKAVQQTCKSNSGSFKISGHSSSNGCTGLANDLNSRPISVAVDANNWSKYSSGIFSNCKTSLDHGVLLVGMTN